MLCVRYIATQDVYEFASPFVISFPFFALFILTKGKGVGFGDILMFAGVGMLLGMDQGIAALLIAIWTGALVGAVLQLINRKTYTRKYALPFVPCIIFGTLIVLFTNISFSTIITCIDLLSKSIFSTIITLFS
jgi:prepilin signal peptidase PulO-like enzyme (type II secretory pathway)